MICPKDGNKIDELTKKCPYCGLKQESIISASNLEAKKIIKSRLDTSNVVMSKVVPKDVSKTKLLLLCIFLGFVGAHCFYVGRMKRGFIIPLLFIFSITFIFLPETWVLHAYLSNSVAGVIGCAGCFCWWWDIIRIVFNRFPIPVVLNNYW